MDVVVDTNVMTSGLRSRFGWSRQVLEAILFGAYRPVVSTSLVLEYEAVLKRDAQLQAAGLTSEAVDAIIDLTIQRARLVTPWFSWRPQLPDPKDESIFALAIAAQAPIVTFNEKDFRSAALMFGVKVQSPKQLLGASSP